MLTVGSTSTFPVIFRLTSDELTIFTTVFIFHPEKSPVNCTRQRIPIIVKQF
jgi:hypothetical protein